jgi:DNA-directed RNA polymerase subunit RPC12/RpoP
MGVTTGTKLPDGTVVLKGDPQQMRKITCMGCQEEAKLITRPDGKRIYKCVACGREWRATKF